MNQEYRVLHLEDLPSDAMLAHREMGKVLENFTVRVVETEAEFKAELEEFKPHIVISDFQLPSFNGIRALEISLEIAPLTPVIILTGSLNEDTAVDCIKAGATDYIIKGHIKRLGPAILNALEQKEIKIEKIRAEKDLQKSEEKFRSLFENHSAVKFLIDAETGDIEDANKSASTYYGWSIEELRRMNISDINTLPAEDIKNELMKAKNLRSSNLDFLHRLKDGSLRNVEVFSSQVEIDGKNYLHTIIHDVTEKKSAERALLQSEENYHRSLSESPLGIRIVTIDGKTIFANKAFLDIYEFSNLEEFNNTPAKIRYTPESFVKHQERKERRKNGEDVFQYELSIARKNGEIRHLKVSRKEVLWDGVRHFQAINQDITEQRKLTIELIAAKEKAEESDRLKTAFLHNISHEIRTPMNAIVGFSGLLNDPELLPENREKFTDIIVKSSNQLLSIISDIISIATIEAGQEKITEKEIDLDAALLLLHKQFLILAEKQNVGLNLKPCVPGHEEWIICDETKLVQIITNLIGNALKFTKTGHIDFGYTVKDAEIEFFVADTGLGIPGEMHEEIFKRFRQVESNSTRQYGGSGLGLSISKAYVELLGGKMWFDSELNKGSTFHFTIPYHSAIKKTLPGQPDSGYKLEMIATRTFLIAEDDDLNFMLLKKLLSGKNIHIIKAVNGLEAVGFCKSNKDIDLVLMDIKMPVMDGYEATKQIREFLPDLPIIAQTAYTTDMDKDKAFACGCNDFIRKPINKELLISKINTQLEKK